MVLLLERGYVGITALIDDSSPQFYALANDTGLSEFRLNIHSNSGFTTPNRC